MLIIMALLLAVAAPLAAEAPQTKVYRIGLLLQASPLPAGPKLGSSPNSVWGEEPADGRHASDRSAILLGPPSSRQGGRGPMRMETFIRNALRLKAHYVVKVDVVHSAQTKDATCRLGNALLTPRRQSSRQCSRRSAITELARLHRGPLGSPATLPAGRLALASRG
jgi:hypothetical protein